MAKNNQKFTKEQLLSSKTFNYPRDTICAVLDDNELYTKDEAADKIAAFLNKEIK